ncbi:MAG: hypothetical protein H0U85_04645 [Gemmatimonadales bacterium]|nr:hypothetical protein [Gemmatimonadales bacterium]
MRKWLGIGGVDLGIQVVLTGVLMGFVSSLATPGSEDPAVFGVMAVSLVVLALRRHFGLKHEIADQPSELTAARIDELDQRLAELEHSHARLQEVEERLDFAERLLTQRPDSALQSPPR